MQTTTTNANQAEQLLQMAERLGFGNAKRFRFYTSQIFPPEWQFSGKNLLDIGGGGGLMSLFAAAMGAAHVVCLEPEAAGSTANIQSRFEKLRGSVRTGEAVEYLGLRLEDYNPENRLFDCVLLHNSINHLDESAVTNLADSEDARQKYIVLFRKIAGLCRSGATIVVCDCSNKNLWQALRMHNVFAPTIEWHKHQRPEVWADLLGAVGFTRPRVKWTSFNRLGRAGVALSGNPFAAYLLISHFCLTMTYRGEHGRT